MRCRCQANLITMATHEPRISRTDPPITYSQKCNNFILTRQLKKTKKLVIGSKISHKIRHIVYNKNVSMISTVTRMQVRFKLTLCVFAFLELNKPICSHSNQPNNQSCAFLPTKSANMTVLTKTTHIMGCTSLDYPDILLPQEHPR